MRYGIISDIHGNLEALEVVLDSLSRNNIDRYLCLGDVVGYGADPERCLKLVRELKCLQIAGNHDHAAVGCLDITSFNQYARDAALWTREHLSEDMKEYLRSLPFVIHGPDFVIVHGSLNKPELYNYIQTPKDAEPNFKILDKRVCFIGHSHMPISFLSGHPIIYDAESTRINLRQGSRAIVNVGSVGQPRDDDPRSCHAIYDTEQSVVELVRLEYDVAAAAGKIEAAGLPHALSIRLELGK